MIETLAALITGLLSVIIIGNVFFFIQIKRERQRIANTVRTFVEAPDEKTPSPLAQVIDYAAEGLGSKIVAQAKATFMGYQSGESKQRAKLEQAMITDGITQRSPLAGAVLTSFPAVSKLLKKQPALLPLAERFLPGLFGAAKKNGEDEAGVGMPDITGSDLTEFK